MLTDAGSRSGLSNRTNGTKKLPHIPTNVKMPTTDTPGQTSGRITYRSVCIRDAPSVQAASSRTSGTLSMKFFISQIANGRPVEAMNNIVPEIVSIRFSWTNSPYTGTMIAVIGRPVENRIDSRNG